MVAHVCVMPHLYYDAPPPAGPPLPANSPINVLGPNGYPVRNDNSSSNGEAYLGAGNGTTPPEIYTASHPDALGSNVPILPGQSAILTNEATGMYCQLRGLPSNSSQLGMFCDQPTPATATVMTYTGKWCRHCTLAAGCDSPSCSATAASRRLPLLGLQQRPLQSTSNTAAAAVD